MFGPMYELGLQFHGKVDVVEDTTDTDTKVINEILADTHALIVDKSFFLTYARIHADRVPFMKLHIAELSGFVPSGWIFPKLKAQRYGYETRKSHGLLLIQIPLNVNNSVFILAPMSKKSQERKCIWPCNG